MINKTKIKIPKKYQPFISLVEKEYQMGGDDYMYWAYAIDGYYFTATEAHSANGYTQSQLLQDLRTVEKCNCEECNFKN